MSRVWDELGASERPRRTAELLGEGLGRRRLATDFERTSHGRWRLAGRPRTSTQRIVDAAAVLPAGAVIGGWAAAWLQKVVGLDGLDDFSLAELPVDVLLPPGGRRRSQPGLTYHQTAKPTACREIRGIPVTPLLLTVEQLARWARDLTEAVVAVDAVLAARVSSADRVRSCLAAAVGRGSVQAQRAAELCRVGVRSSWETRLRLFYEVELGLGRLRVNEAVFELSGELLGIPDLLDEEAGLALEYDGGRWADRRGHRDVAQHREDNVREERFERAGLIVVRADRGDLGSHRRRLGARLGGARADGLSRDRSRDRWTLETPSSWTGLPR